MNRKQAIDQITNGTDDFDVIIVGGGATGLGAAVDAAARGYRVVLVEAEDFAKGTSSRSTKLVHGGVRYLKQGNIPLVREALHERGLLYRNAPHLVSSMMFVIPNYRWWDGPFYWTGMKVYDALAGKLGIGKSSYLSKEKVLELVPTVETNQLQNGVSYYDGQFDDTRLAVELARTAIDRGACIVNYMRCEKLIKENGRVRGICVRDGLDGSEYEIRGKSVLNATGVFVDTLRRQDVEDSKNIVAVSQGVHIILPKEFLPGDASLMIPKTDDGRVLFCVPWHDRVVVGTTDTPLPSGSIEPRALTEERDFIMEHAAKYLSKDPVDDDVLSIFAGLRPLVKAGDDGNTAALSRDHTILVSDSGLITITGGKWTTYRKMAEDVVDQAEKVAALDHRPSSTHELAIHGATRETIPEKNLAIYGSSAAEIRELGKTKSGLEEKIHPNLPYQRSEVIWHARHEMACTVEDVLARRTRALLLDAAASAEAAPGVAQLMAEELGKDEAWANAQVESYSELAKGYTFKCSESTAAN